MNEELRHLFTVLVIKLRNTMKIGRYYIQKEITQITKHSYETGKEDAHQSFRIALSNIRNDTSETK